MTCSIEDERNNGWVSAIWRVSEAEILSLTRILGNLVNVKQILYAVLRQQQGVDSASNPCRLRHANLNAGNAAVVELYLSAKLCMEYVVGFVLCLERRRHLRLEDLPTHCVN
jgi:hypothetical protein